MVFNMGAYRKCKKLKEWDIPHKETHSGIIVGNKIMLAKNKTRWKKLGSFDWYPYYKLETLIQALYEDALDEYAKEQQKRDRKHKAVPINHEWKDKEREKLIKGL